MKTISLIEPHGGELVDRVIPDEEVSAAQERARRLPRVQLDEREIADLELIATGAASPLRGFIGSRDYTSVLEHMRLANGTLWPLPLTLAVDAAVRPSLDVGKEVALHDSLGRLWGLLQVSELFERDPIAEARWIYGTDSTAHPGVAYLLSRPRSLVGGEIRVLPLPEHLPFAQHRLTPRGLRERIRSRGWKKVAGFQTRNPIHRAHEHLTKVALEFVDGLVIHPLVGETKNDDVPASVRFRAYELLVEKYYPKDRTLLAAFPAAMRYAGPREAIFHTLVRKNYGITHLIVGRDHAGVSNFYGPFDAHRLLEQLPAEELGVTPLKFDAAFYCRACGGPASSRTCPHEPAHRLELSGTKVREILRSGGQLPEQFTRPEIAEILREHYTGVSTLPHTNRVANGVPPTNGVVNGAANGVAPINGGANGADARQISAVNGKLVNGTIPSTPVSFSREVKKGFILWLTGLSGAGKSTLAQAVRARLTTKIEVLDGDEVRTYLSKGLGFSKEDRDTNIRRIGYVASLLARNNVAVVTAAISPYAETRAEVRRLAERDGTPFIEVHVDAPLDTLIQRDVKGLYRKALAGEIAHFTGVSDPYEPPPQPDIRVQTDRESVAESATRILAELARRGLITRGAEA